MTKLRIRFFSSPEKGDLFRRGLLVASSWPRRGLVGGVTSFDAAVGLGTIESEQGESHAFHCIEIADGSRAIAVGTDVTFEVLCKLGRYEAASIT